MVLDFYANWCGPCLLLAKELEKVRHRSAVAYISDDCMTKRAKRSEAFIGCDSIWLSIYSRRKIGKENSCVANPKRFIRQRRQCENDKVMLDSMPLLRDACIGWWQVAEHFGEGVQILKIDTDENPDLSSQLRVISK